MERRQLTTAEDLAGAHRTLGERWAALHCPRDPLGYAPAWSRGWALSMRAYRMSGELHHVTTLYRQAEVAHRRDLGVRPRRPASAAGFTGARAGEGMRYPDQGSVLP